MRYFWRAVALHVGSLELQVAAGPTDRLEVQLHYPSVPYPSWQPVNPGAALSLTPLLIRLRASLAGVLGRSRCLVQLVQPPS